MIRNSVTKLTNKWYNPEGGTYGVVASGGVRGEEYTERGDEEEGKHGGDEDPIREEVAKCGSDTGSSTDAANSGGPDRNRHLLPRNWHGKV